MSAVEIEAKFAVADDIDVPPLATIDGIAAVADTVVHELSAVYFDTADLRLTRNKITLRRRTGGKDDGWHVKLPDMGMGRREIRTDLGEYEFTPPEEIMAIIRPYVRTHDIDPIAQIDNERHEYLLANASGDIVAEFVDDHVTAYSLLPTGDISRWREWECELVNGPDGTPLANEALLEAARRVFLNAGAQPADSPSKLLTALGDSIASAEPLAQPMQLPAGTPEAQVLAALEKNRTKIIACDPLVRSDEFDSVHQMRVATRELRSHMSTFRGILGGESYEHTARELKHLASVLGVARDAEVVADRFRHALAENTLDDLGLDEADTGMKLVDSIDDIYRHAHSDIVEFLDSDRYADLLDSLDDLLAHPPLTHPTPKECSTPVDAVAISADSVNTDAENADADTADAPTADNSLDSGAAENDAPEAAEEVLFHHLTQAMRKVRALDATARKQWSDTSLPLAQREDNMHAVRKAIKKLRYSAEAAGAASDIPTGKLYKACSAAQDVLGTFQDSVTAREALVTAAQRAHIKGENTFLYGVLFQQELALGAAALQGYEPAVDSVIAAYKKLEKKRDKIAAKKAKELRQRLKAEAKAARKAQRERAKAERDAARKAARLAAVEEARAKQAAAAAAREAAEAALREAEAAEAAAREALAASKAVDETFAATYEGSDTDAASPLDADRAGNDSATSEADEQ